MAGTGRRTVLEAEQVVAHDVPPGFLPYFGRIQRGEVHLLSADGVHLLPHNLLDLEEAWPRKR
jgi:hypothetical protein